jgi:HEAT repeat protein
VRNDPSVDVRAAAAGALGVTCDIAVTGEVEALGDVAERARQALLELLENRAEHPLVRGKALESVAAFGSQPVVSSAIDAARQSDDESLRASSLIAMGRTCDRRWLGEILRELRSDDVALRKAAAIACGRMGETDAIVSLGTVARDSDREVRNAAIWSIGEIGGGAAANVLTKLLKDASKDERTLIEAAIEEANLGEATGDAWW